LSGKVQGKMLVCRSGQNVIFKQILQKGVGEMWSGKLETFTFVLLWQRVQRNWSLWGNTHTGVSE